jgi:hypothetical protein
MVEHCTGGGGRIQAAVGTQDHQLWWCGGRALVVVGVTQTPMLLTCCGVTRHSVVVDRILSETLWMAAAVFRGGVHTCWLFLRSACLSALLGCVGVTLASLICCWQELCAAARLDVAPHSTFLDGWSALVCGDLSGSCTCSCTVMPVRECIVMQLHMAAAGVMKSRCDAACCTASHVSPT